MAKTARGFAAGVALFAVVAGGVAIARGPDMNLPIFGVTPGSFSPSGHSFRSFYSDPESEAPAPRAHYDDGERHKSKRATAYGFGYGKAVCVRLCDGSFFPTASVSGGEAACASQCPDAPVALYTMPTDRIEDAVSSDGRPYSALPVARRFETSFEGPACSCHRNATVAVRAKEILNDTTLRKGDVVMTATGFRVYEGDGYGPTGPKDFLNLSQARVSKEQRATLTAMEHASAGSPARAAPSVVALRPKGNVTVDNGPATP